MAVRTSLSLFALAAGMLGSTALAGAQASPYPLPTPAAGGGAQSQGEAQHAHGKNRLRASLEQLDLTPAQKTQIRSAFTSFRAARGTATPISYKQLRSNIEAVLTPAQAAQLKTLMRRRPAGPAAGGTPSPA